MKYVKYQFDSDQCEGQLAITPFQFSCLGTVQLDNYIHLQDQDFIETENNYITD